MYPEDGRSAIFAAARAVADMRLGRIDHQSSANVGVITGGTARNIVPEWCTVEAEARSHDPETLAILIQEMLDAIGFAASTSDCTAETEIEETYRGYRFTSDEPAVVLAAEGLRRAGYEPVTALSGGGADANVFNERGLRCVNLGNGMTDIHTPDERIAVADLEGMVEVTLAIIDAATETVPWR
jgi:tripeptide aminopeptidase